MSLAEHFKDFCKDELPISESEFNKWCNRLKEITKKLNKKYYPDDDFEDIETDNCYIVGSVGRGTAIAKTSDFDCIFKLPQEVYDRFNNHSGNGQSKLLQEVKDEIALRYTSTKIKGDGQVVSITFTSNPTGTIELVPAFEQDNGDFKFPNTHNGGSWKITKPTSEISECSRLNDETGGHFTNFCRLLRKWKNKNGFAFKGLLIDTLVSNYLEDEGISSISYSDYEELIPNLFKFLSEQDKGRSYWLALGSNQQIENSDNGKFITKAKKTYNLLKDSTNLIQDYRATFGNQFAKSDSSASNTIAPEEQFIEDMFPIHIQYNLELDCDVTQNGFRKYTLRDILSRGFKLKDKKSLDFYILSTNIPSYFSGVEYFWKVRNVGAEAIKRGRERGQIIKGNTKKHENTEFKGMHYVECYAVFEGIVIARGRIEVPIDPYSGLGSI
ncbi:Uncharacterised protein [Streptococcus equi subsp. zooepidemicus]|uniref:nucleotide-binding domain-containing protein n=1 Tax=Streptococcus equi TaxID=1336 RepID=UPI000DA38E97|nr:nucleotidyltransferase [Streptococcus equi]SQF82189.1 Uncharacterised protein [Streptococcus equi subsp. zooepidemicus]